MARQNAQQQPPASGTNQTSAQPRAATPTITGLASNQQQNILQAGSDQLPQGLTLPEGWTMMPLQPIQQPPQFPMGPMQIPSFAQVPPLGQMQMGGMVVPGMPQQQEQPWRTPQPSQTDLNRSATPIIRSLVEERDRLATQRGRLEEENAELAARRARLEVVNARLRGDSLSNDVRDVLDTFTSHDENERSRTTSTAPSTSNATQDRPTPVPPRQTQMSSSVPNTQNTQTPQSNSTSQTSQITTSIRSSRVSPTSHRTQRSSTAPRVSPAHVAPAPSVSSSESSDEDNNRRLTSSHRPTRSIGSSWGFPSNEETSEGRNQNPQPNRDRRPEEEDHDDDEDDEDDEQGSDEGDSKNDKRISQPVSVRSSMQTVTDTQKRKKPTVEDEDDDSGESS